MVGEVRTREEHEISAGETVRRECEEGDRGEMRD